MTKAVLTDGTDSNTIDIHCGGVDLKFPHHENEIAQSNCAHDGAPLANYWVHNEFLNMGSEKMSKSLGNVKLIHDLLKDWDGEVIRLALLKAHYRSELVWTEDLLEEAKQNLESFYSIMRQISLFKLTSDNVYDEGLYLESFYDDLNSQAGISALYAIAPGIRRILLIIETFEKHLNGSSDDSIPNQVSSLKMVKSYFEADFAGKAELLKQARLNATRYIGRFQLIANLLGLLQKDPEAWFKGGASADEEAEFDAIALRRQEARAAKDWAAADVARDEATAKGIVLEDGPDGTTWRKA